MNFVVAIKFQDSDVVCCIGAAKVLRGNADGCEEDQVNLIFDTEWDLDKRLASVSINLDRKQILVFLISDIRKLPVKDVPPFCKLADARCYYEATQRVPSAIQFIAIKNQVKYIIFSSSEPDLVRVLCGMRDIV
jgi:hypothetical protein